LSVTSDRGFTNSDAVMGTTFRQTIGFDFDVAASALVGSF
jgi:hypothetical protein